MNGYSLRIDTPNSLSFTKVVELINTVCKEWVYGLENQSVQNPHAHFVIFDMNIQAQHLRKQLRDLGLRGNGGYSLSKNKDDIKAIAYAIKEDNYQLSDNFNKDTIETAKLYNLKVQNEIKDKKSTPKNFLDKYSHIIEQVIQSDIQGLPYIKESNKIKLATLILKEYDNKAIRYSQVKLIYDTIMINFSPTFKKQFLEKIISC